ncbi:MAG TPA: hypothetical protein VLB86_13615 [Gaiellaceae bacterium]|nr:hypothetical protein [Gaiellaceae bacterium]
MRILDGERQKWIDEGRPLRSDVPARTAQAYLADERDETIRGYRQQVQEQLGLPATRSSASAAPRSSPAAS